MAGSAPTDAFYGNGSVPRIRLNSLASCREVEPRKVLWGQPSVRQSGAIVLLATLGFASRLSPITGTSLRKGLKQ